MAIGLGAQLLGGLFRNRSQNRAAQIDTQNQQALLDYQSALRNREDETNEQRRALRGSLFRGFANASGLSNLVPAGYSEFSQRVRPGVQAPRLQSGGTGRSLIGDMFEGAGSALIAGNLQDRYEGAYGQGQAQGYLDSRTPAGGTNLIGAGGGGGDIATEISLPTNPYVNTNFTDNDENDDQGW